MSDEEIEIKRFTVEGVPKIDIRWWRHTNTGPRPTKSAIIINQAMLTRLIWSLQRVHIQISRDAIREATEEHVKAMRAKN